MSGCPLYPMFKTKSFLNTLIAVYCQADYNRCVRFVKASAGEQVPPTLLPNGRSLNESRS
jgi:hypothetical protein